VDHSGEQLASFNCFDVNYSNLFEKNPFCLVLDVCLVDFSLIPQSSFLLEEFHLQIEFSESFGRFHPLLFQ
jgi:hypothetical protein